MQWPVVNSDRNQPDSGDYSDWKPEIADDCQHSCVYCAITEALNGGLDNFHVEHYRPKSKFDELRKTITNLFLACAICNRFKSNDWPNEPDGNLDVVHYPDPSEQSYDHYFEIDSKAGLLRSETVAGKYLLAKLFLNRPQLIRLRRVVAAANGICELRRELQEHARELVASKSANKPALMMEVLETVNRLADIAEKMRSVAPYRIADVRRG